MKTKTYILPSAAAIALLFTSCEKPAVTSTTPPAAETAVVSDDAYPLKTCVVSGEVLGDMGKPYAFQHEGTTVKLCCKSCLEDFNKEPAKYMSKIKEVGTR